MEFHTKKKKQVRERKMESTFKKVGGPPRVTDGPFLGLAKQSQQKRKTTSSPGPAPGLHRGEGLAPSEKPGGSRRRTRLPSLAMQLAGAGAC